MIPFGYSYLLDMYNNKKGAANDLELHYRFLETLVDRLGMTKMSAPFVIHGPRSRGVEMFPDKSGVSVWVPLVESGIQIHSMEPTRFITLDVYSCRHFDSDEVMKFAQETFGFTRHEEHFLHRGLYCSPPSDQGGDQNSKWSTR
jgi:S-adenosylmethionine decarboxylase